MAAKQLATRRVDLRLQPSGNEGDGSSVGIVVGSGTSRQQYDLDKALLMRVSGYFRVAIQNLDSSRFVESRDGFITLAEESPAVFAQFVDWLLDDTLDGYADDADRAIDMHNALIELWLFADRRDIPLLQNEAISELHTIMHRSCTIPLNRLRLVYENTPETSRLRHFLTFAQSILLQPHQAQLLWDSPHWWTEDAMRDFAMALLERSRASSRSDFTTLDMCNWHIHPAGIRCHKDSGNNS